MRILGISLAAWAFGSMAYLGTGRAIWNQRISPGDLGAALFWSASAAVITVTCVFTPVMFGLRNRLVTRPWNAWWAFVVVGAVLGFLPVLLIVSLWSDRIGRALLSSEAGLFYSLFGTFGAVFGGGFYLAYDRRSTPHAAKCRPLRHKR